MDLVLPHRVKDTGTRRLRVRDLLLTRIMGSNFASASLLTVIPHANVLKNVSSTLVARKADKGYNAYREFNETGE